MKKLIASALFALIFTTPAHGQGTEVAFFTGNYTVEGFNFNGSQYTGTATITSVADEIYRVEWNINGEQFSGIGFLDGSKLLVGGLDFPLVVSYTPDSVGNLVGTWLIPGAPATSTEKLTRVSAANVAGRLARI